MLVTNIVDEDFVNYRKPSMFIGTAYCDWKCCVEGGFSPSICQNHALEGAPRIEVDINDIVLRFVGNPITEAIVFGGLEPMIQIDDVEAFVSTLRARGDNSDVVVYTGYYPHEIQSQLARLKCYSNVVVKFGRYLPNAKPKFDEILGIELASENQYGERIS